MKPSVIKIEKGVPIPSSHRTGISATLKQMKIGDSFVLPTKDRQSAVNAARNTGIKVCAKAISPTEIRVWRKE